MIAADDTSTPTIERIQARAYTIPTDSPESDGTLEWDSTTLVIVEATAGGRTGIGYTYTHAAAADVITTKLAEVLTGRNAGSVAASWTAMLRAIRNYGSTGLVSMAVSAVDIALWDLKARLLDQPLVQVLDAVHEAAPIYGSGGFCNYSDKQLTAQLQGWVDAGIPRVKMKTGARPADDRHRLTVARAAIDDGVELFADANGAFTRAQALEWAQVYADFGVRWFEEPVTSDDLDGLHLVCERAPAGMDVAAGEYGWNLPYFERMLAAQAVDCLQADVTRCLGISGFLRVGALCDARSLDVSAHCAPQISAHAATAVWHLRHLEYFHDHDRIERMVFDGCLDPEPGGLLRPDRSRPGCGLSVKWPDIDEWRVK